MASRAGVSAATLSRIETGKQVADAALVVVLAAIIDVPAATLLGTTAAPDVAGLIAALARLPKSGTDYILSARATFAVPAIRKFQS